MGKLLLVIITSLIVIGFFIASINNIDFNENGSKEKFAEIYFSWLIKGGQNIKDLVGFTVDQDWSLNQTNFTEILNERYEN